MFKTKLRKTDTMYSRYIRTRDGWRCLACGERSKDYSEGGQGLDCSHYWGRGHENTRFDGENCVSLCTYHHRLWGGEERHEYTKFMISRLGDTGYDLLDVRAHTYKKRDDKLDAIIITALLKELKEV